MSGRQRLEAAAGVALAAVVLGLVLGLGYGIGVAAVRDVCVTSR